MRFVLLSAVGALFFGAFTSQSAAQGIESCVMPPSMAGTHEFIRFDPATNQCVARRLPNLPSGPEIATQEAVAAATVAPAAPAAPGGLLGGFAGLGGLGAGATIAAGVGVIGVGALIATAITSSTPDT